MNEYLKFLTAGLPQGSQRESFQGWSELLRGELFMFSPLSTPHHQESALWISNHGKLILLHMAGSWSLNQWFTAAFHYFKIWSRGGRMPWVIPRESLMWIVGHSTFKFQTLIPDVFYFLPRKSLNKGLSILWLCCCIFSCMCSLS